MIGPVTRYDQSSRCSGPGAPTFRWYGNPQCAVGNDVETAVAALVAAISPPGRVWNPYALGMARAEFRKRIQKAQLGQLAPVDEVKAVDVRNPPPLYEIRWQGVHVTDRLDNGKQRFGEVLVRMYHSEPASRPSHFIGHHAHEKDVTASDVNAAQQLEIKTAIGWHGHGHAKNWGIASPDDGI